MFASLALIVLIGIAVGVTTALFGFGGGFVAVPVISLGFGIGAAAAFLGVGGSVMTVPLIRRAGTSMAAASSLANPLTVAVVAPAFAVSLLLPPGVEAARATAATLPWLVGSVDVPSALALLIGAIPVIVLLRRRPPRIPDSVHAWTYLALLAVSASAVALAR